MTQEDISRVETFIGNVPPEMAVVVKEKNGRGELVLHGDRCSIYRTTMQGNLLNIRCVGARASGDGRVFVAWKETRESGLKIAEYRGEPILSEHNEMF